MRDEADALLQFDDVFRKTGLAKPGAGAGFVEHIDRFAGEVTFRNTRAGVGDGTGERFLRVRDPVKLLVDLF